MGSLPRLDRSLPSLLAIASSSEALRFPDLLRNDRIFCSIFFSLFSFIVPYMVLKASEIFAHQVAQYVEYLIPPLIQPSHSRDSGGTYLIWMFKGAKRRPFTPGVPGITCLGGILSGFRGHEPILAYWGRFAGFPAWRQEDRGRGAIWQNAICRSITYLAYVCFRDWGLGIRVEMKSEIPIPNP